jgi:hypothetical protein
MAVLADRGPAVIRVAVGIGIGTEAAVPGPDALFFDMLGSNADGSTVIAPAGNHVEAVRAPSPSLYWP